MQNKSTTIVSELKDFFTSSEKAINTILTVSSSLIYKTCGMIGIHLCMEYLVWVKMFSAASYLNKILAYATVLIA